MKTLLLIDIDTDREKPVIIGKPPEITPPANAEEAATMIKTDIACMCEALSTLILIADENNYGKKEAFVERAIEVLKNNLETKKSNGEVQG